MITYKRLTSVLNYDRESGVFRWIFSKGTKRAGSVAGSIRYDRTRKPYCQICLDRKSYQAHRLAHLYMEGVMPADQMDHIDGDSLNNRWSNLREVSNSENQKNARISVKNRSGVTGVDFYKPSGKWRATVRVDGVKKHLGYFNTIDEAAEARKAADKLYGFHPNHGNPKPVTRKQAQEEG